MQSGDKDSWAVADKMKNVRPAVICGDQPHWVPKVANLTSWWDADSPLISEQPHCSLAPRETFPCTLLPSIGAQSSDRDVLYASCTLSDSKS